MRKKKKKRAQILSLPLEPKVMRLYDALYATIDKNGAGLTFAEIIGTMEMLKTSITVNGQEK